MLPRRMRLWVSLVAPLLILPPGRGFETGMSFSGSLERVGDHSISVKMADRIVIDALLPNTTPFEASAIAAKYRMGDEVEISCKPIPPFWEADTSRYQSLEVTAMRLRRRPSPEEVSRMLEARSREGKNLLERPEPNFSAPNRPAIRGLLAPGNLKLRGGSIWNTRRTCRTSWQMRPRSEIGVARNWAPGAITIPSNRRSLSGGATWSGSRSAGTGRRGTNPSTRCPALNGTRASRPKSVRYSTRSVLPRSSTRDGRS